MQYIRHKVTLNEILAYSFAVLMLLVIPTIAFNSCNKTKHQYILTTSSSKDTVEHFNKIDSNWVYYHNNDGTTIYLYKAKIDTIK